MNDDVTKVCVMCDATTHDVQKVHVIYPYTEADLWLCELCDWKLFASND